MSILGLLMVLFLLVYRSAAGAMAQGSTRSQMIAELQVVLARLEKISKPALP